MTCVVLTSQFERASRAVKLRRGNETTGHASEFRRLIDLIGLAAFSLLSLLETEQNWVNEWIGEQRASKKVQWHSECRYDYVSRFNNSKISNTLNNHDSPKDPNQLRYPQRDERLTLAMKSYQNNPKQSVRGLAKHFEVAPSTLQEQLGGATSRTDEMPSRRRLSLTETWVLADHAAEMQKLYFPLTPQDIRLEAQHIWYSKDPAAEAHGNTLGVNWYNQVFLKDNPEMASKMGKGLDQNRATCTSHAQLAAWYQDVRFEAIYNWYPSSSTQSS